MGAVLDVGGGFNLAFFHGGNFGAFASPERRLVFDVNDFDETLPGPFEWDVKRLAASFAVAGRDNGFPAKARRKIILAAAEGYRTAMQGFAQQSRDAPPPPPAPDSGQISAQQTLQPRHHHPSPS